MEGCTLNVLQLLAKINDIFVHTKQLEMKNTPLQKLIDRLNDIIIDAQYVLEHQSDYHLNDVTDAKKQVMFTEVAKFEAQDLLKEEKQLIETAFDYGVNVGLRGGLSIDAEQYFNETFEQNN